MVGDGRLRELEERHQLADADLAGVLAEDVDQLHPDGIAERLGDGGEALRGVGVDSGEDDRLAAGIARRALLLRGKLERGSHAFTYIY